MFPAAHSMDTTWFAVDDDGYVAMLETGENGAYPVTGRSVDDEARAALDEWRAVHFLVHDRARVLELADAIGDMEPLGERPRPLCVLLAEGEEHAAFERAFSHVPWRVANASAPRVLVSDAPVTVADWGAMRDHVATTLVLPVDEVVGDPASDDDGLFHFRHMDLSEPGAYERDGNARAGTRVDSLPAELVPRLGLAKLPLRFASADTFHLADHFADHECVTWDDVPLRVRAVDAPAVSMHEASERPPARRYVVPAWAMLVPIVAVVLFLAYACARAGKP